MTNENQKKGLVSIIAASSLGTLIEWYDFYIFGSLATIISTKFFPSGNPTAALLSTLATFAAGFVVRPFGALFFGRLGDLIGRKYTFLVTLIIMGLSTFLIGCVPAYETIGFLAPVLVLLLRLLQGLALGGEYGGAATYVAEHSPVNQRGFYTSWIQTTATLGLFISLFVIIITKGAMNDESFNDWGWRMPFWISIFMVAVSVLIRMKMQESPVFAKAKSEGKTSKNPLKESFGNKLNFKFVLLALFGATMGQGVVWYTGQFYALSFIQNTLSIDITQASKIIMLALGMGTPFFLVFGGLSDKIGRKWIMLAGMLVAIFSYRPIYSAMHDAGSVENKHEIPANKRMDASVTGDKANVANTIKTTVTTHEYSDGTLYKETKKETMPADAAKVTTAADIKITKAVVLDNGSFWKLVWLVFIQVIFVTMVYGPIAAFLVEMFPLKIRYTSMSLPYHIGNGIFGDCCRQLQLFLLQKPHRPMRLQPKQELRFLMINLFWKDFGILSLLPAFVLLSALYILMEKIKKCRINLYNINFLNFKKMNKIRRLAGIVWIILGLAGGYYLIVNQAIPKFRSDKTEDVIPAIIYAFILTPIIVGGLLIFGKYALQGEYDDKV